MALYWSRRASADLLRLHSFLAPKSANAATERLRRLRGEVLKLVQFPRLGERLEEIAEPEVRRIFVAEYEVRYQVVAEDITVLRVWHTREDR